MGAPPLPSLALGNSLLSQWPFGTRRTMDGTDDGTASPPLTVAASRRPIRRYWYCSLNEFTVAFTTSESRHLRC